MSYTLQRTFPEALGISSESIIDFICTAKDRSLAMHSLMILRHGEVAAELYWSPYSAKSQNHVYSFSKSFVSAAIGLAVDEGLLSYDDRLCSFFPRYIESDADERIHSVTIEHLLTMTSGMVGFNEITSLTSSDWVRTFLNSRLASFPGEKFNYNSLNTYMLTAVLRKVTGIGLVEYLTPRLFEPLGITGVYSDKCPMGRDIGGWGLHVKTEDMAKFGQLLLNRGNLRGRQILPIDWCEKSRLSHADTLSDPKFPDNPDVKSGYGYQLWINRDKTSFRADGMLGQFALILPELDCVIVSTAGNMDEYAVLDLIWEKIVPAIGAIPDNSPQGDSYIQLSELSGSLSIVSTEISIVPFLMQNVNDKTYTMPPNRQSVYPFMLRYPKRHILSGIENFKFNFGKTCSLTWTECEQTNTVPLIFDGHFHDTEITFFESAVSCSVYSKIKEISGTVYELEVLMSFTDIPHSSHLFFTFNDSNLSVRFDELPNYTDMASFAGGLFSSGRNFSPYISKALSRIADVSLTAECN